MSSTKGTDKGLTSIHGCIHCHTTPEPCGNRDDIERICSDEFARTLAEVAISVAKRRTGKGGQLDCPQSAP